MADEQSKWDEEDEDDEHEHTEACGHTAKDHERIERLQKNMKKFLADNAEDMLEPGMYLKLIKKIEKRLRQQGINPSLSTLKTFREGFEFGMVASIRTGSDVGPIFAGINKMINDKEKGAKPKVEIDIAKSLPLPPNEPPKPQKEKEGE